MNNVKKFEDFLDRMQGLLDNAEKQGHTIVRVEDLENAFPELKESEESIIRDIRVVLESSATRFFKKNGQMPVWYDKSVAWLEKQGEQKPIDKVEPKFHLNEWVVTDKNDVVQIKAVNNGYYTIGNGMDFSMSYVDRCWHQWTFQDVKDGDVLAAEPIEGYHSPFVAIYKKKYEEDFDSYCFTGYDGKFYEGEGGHSTKDIHPATKEQRDLLFQKMKEAGYEWYAEKKELKKIEQKSAWSDEDETELTNTIIMLKEGAGLHFDTNDITKAVDWLKSIKDRYTWKPSDEQMNALQTAIGIVGDLTSTTSLLKEIREQLKKLKA